MSDRRHRRAIKLTVLVLRFCTAPRTPSSDIPRTICGMPFWTTSRVEKKFCGSTCKARADMRKWRAKQPKARTHKCLRCERKFRTKNPSLWYCKRACREGVREDSDAEYGLNTRTAAERKRWASNLAKRTGGTMDRKRTRKERGLKP